MGILHTVVIDHEESFGRDTSIRSASEDGFFSRRRGVATLTLETIGAESTERSQRKRQRRTTSPVRPGSPSRQSIQKSFAIRASLTPFANQPDNQRHQVPTIHRGTQGL
jgi:hypothetical protein